MTDLAPQHQAAVDAAPPLTDDQAATIAAIFRSVLTCQRYDDLGCRAPDCMCPEAAWPDPAEVDRNCPAHSEWGAV